jgi:hypothetical protein
MVPDQVMQAVQAGHWALCWFDCNKKYYLIKSKEIKAALSSFGDYDDTKASNETDNEQQK